MSGRVRRCRCLPRLRSRASRGRLRAPSSRGHGAASRGARALAGVPRARGGGRRAAEVRGARARGVPRVRAARAWARPSALRSVRRGPRRRLVVQAQRVLSVLRRSSNVGRGRAPRRRRAPRGARSTVGLRAPVAAARLARLRQEALRGGAVGVHGRGVALAPGLSPHCAECAKYPSPRTWRGGVRAARAWDGRGRRRSIRYSHTISRRGRLATRSLHLSPHVVRGTLIALSMTMERWIPCTSYVGRERQEYSDSRDHCRRPRPQAPRACVALHGAPSAGARPVRAS